MANHEVWKDVEGGFVLHDQLMDERLASGEGVRESDVAIAANGFQMAAMGLIPRDVRGLVVDSESGWREVARGKGPKLYRENALPHDYAEKRCVKDVRSRRGFVLGALASIIAGRVGDYRPRLDDEADMQFSITAQELASMGIGLRTRGEKFSDADENATLIGWIIDGLPHELKRQLSEKGGGFGDFNFRIMNVNVRSGVDIRVDIEFSS